MSQEINLNVAPYFDDYNADDDYYKVLFKPGYPVQARELTGLQSILQNQIEKFGQHFFKDGAKIIPGNTSYNNNYQAVEIENTYLGLEVADYIDQIIGTKITGQTSGVTAVVNKIIKRNESLKGNTTLYISYLGSNSTDNTNEKFLNGELLVSSITISSLNTIIASNESFATTISEGATSTASAFHITDGVYFAKGQFLNVETETIILDQYSNTPSYRIGLFIDEQIITADEDTELNDNSQGFNNYAAPGADRLKITASLHKKSLTDFDDNSFVELASVTDGVLRTKTQTSEYTHLADELARRTYVESGDYYTRPFGLNVKNSLNDGLGNNGVFNANQLTYGGATPSEDLALYQVSPGKAFVKGYEVETIAPTFLDIPKTRTTKTIEGQQLNYNTGSTLKVNRTYGVPTIGIGNTYVVSLQDQRIGSATTLAAGKEIGYARVYDSSLQSGSYKSERPDTNEWNLTLYDVQTISELTLNEPITLSIPTHVKGKYSGATAFLKVAVAAGTGLTVYEKEGDFVDNEPLIFDGIENSRIAIGATSYGIGDVKSVFYGPVGTANTFNADTAQSEMVQIGVATITSGGLVQSTSSTFPGVIKVGNLLSYTNTLNGSNDPTYGRVTAIGSSSVTIAAVTNVAGIASGVLPGSTLTVNDLNLLTTTVEGSEDNSFYTQLPRRDLATVDLTDASLTIRKVNSVTINDQRVTGISAGTNQTFLPFTPARYSLVTNDGTTEVLTSDKVQFNAGSTSLDIMGLASADATDATLVTTVTKIKPAAKTKILNRVNAVLINKSNNEASGTNVSIADTTLNDGLVYGNYPYATRVQDENLVLNVPDIIEVFAVYQSADTNDPSAPTVILSSLSGPSAKTGDLVIGETATGQTTGAIAIVAERLTDSKISYLPQNDINFEEGELVIFSESGVRGLVQTLDNPSFDISYNYAYETGQNATFYDYGVINRKADADAPTSKIKVYFSNGYYESSDTGDLTTVNSYDSFNYTNQIQTVDSIRNTDILDIRPRVSNYTVEEDVRSPLEFLGRSFNQSGNSASNILASNEGILTNFSFYLPRIDRVYVTKEGKFQVKYGTPTEKPEKPGSVADALEIASIYLPAYLYNVDQASKTLLEHKRYRMVDIKQLENRIRTLEYYTTLSLLESNTANMFISDTAGMNRFKSGFFVDNFTSLLPQEEAVEFKNSIDIAHKELRPQHHTQSLDLIQGPVEGLSPNVDYSTLAPQGTNIKKTGDIVTLNYSDQKWLEQTFGTRSESVTPFLISFWEGTIELTPASDTWVNTVRLDANIIETEGNFAETLAAASRNMNVDPQTGFSPTIWNAWEITWTGTDVVETTQERTNITNDGGRWVASGNRRDLVVTDTRRVIRDNIRETRDTGVENRTGTRTVVTEQWDQTSAGDVVVSRNLIPFMRSRNVQFFAESVKPNTRMYAFFDGIDVTRFCVPKLLEINMSSGTFSVGETVRGYSPSTGGVSLPSSNATPGIVFRVAQANHRRGPFNAPTNVYPLNPYNGQTLASNYSSTSTVLNVDTFSLSNEVQGDFYGWVSSNMVLVGDTSGAQATVSAPRLLSDISATLIGSFFIPDPNSQTNPRFQTGNNVLTLINNVNNNPNDASTSANEIFISSGAIETVQENVISTRNARVSTEALDESRAASRTTNTQVVSSTVLSSSSTQRTTQTRWVDPLAQSFLVEDDSGIFLTKCDIFFADKDNMNIPVRVQIRTMQNGLPTQIVLPFSEVVLQPDQISTSTDGSVATAVSFDSPVYLEGGTEYCICLLSMSTQYKVYISRVGETDLITQAFVSNQPTLGSLFKSQNASTWEPSQWEDLKFALYRADFVNTGTVEFYNSELTKGNGEIATLMPDSINVTSRKIRVGIGSTLNDLNLKLGNQVSQRHSNATGLYVGNAGIATGTLQVISAGIGYTPTSGSFTYNDVPVTNITGSGVNAKVDISINNGVAVGATISEWSASSGGTGYVPGDVLGISTMGNDVGTAARLSIVSIAHTTQLVLDKVQGDFLTGVGNTVMFKNPVTGIVTTLNWGAGGNVIVNSVEVDTEGMDLLVNHKNHGMYSSQNRVIIDGVQTDVIPTRLTTALTASDTSGIDVNSSTGFGEFENVGVGTTNPGYLKIGEEIISYTETATSSIQGTIVRSVDSTQARTYPTGTLVYKYELGGVSLRRINKTHDFENVTASDPITLDSYKVQLDMGSSGVGRSTAESFPILYMGDTKSTGGSNITATQNIPFEIINPQVTHTSVPGTALSAELRTVSGTSISGSEIPFLDQGFESVTLNRNNFLSTPRIVASKVNEDNKLSTLPGNKSLNMRLTLDTTNTKVSPVIDLQRVSTILTSNRVNDVVTNYATDNRVNSITDDPNAFQYLSKEIQLQNPATSLKIILGAYTNRYSEVRAFYATADTQNFIPIYIPFPGYNNLDERGQVINPADNDGLSDNQVPKSSTAAFESSQIQFSDHTFTIDELPPFRSYRIKIIMTSTNQVYVPRIRDLRAIALA